MKLQTIRLRRGLWLSGLVLSAAILLLPSFLDELSSLWQADLIGRYEEELNTHTADTLAEKRKEAEEYNRKVFEAQGEKAFSYRGDISYDSEYLRLLNGAGGVMGYLEIPSLDLYIPVSHGTSPEVLKNGAGHLYGTSLPIGGPATHAVIAAHSGLRDAELFTGLTDIRKGDLFYIHVLMETHAYKVTEIHVVYPVEEDPYLQVEDGKDLVTLYTCTPYGINDHRLLVCGARTADPPQALSDSSGSHTERIKRKAIFLLLLITAVPLLILAIGLLHIKYDKEDNRPLS